MTKGSTKIFGYGALAMATAVIASVSVSGCTPNNGRVAEPGVSARVAEPDASRVAEVESMWTGCKLDDGTLDALGSQSGLPVAFMVLHTLREDPGGEGTGPVICINPHETEDPIAVQQTDDIVGGDGTLDLLNLDNTGLRYRLEGRVEQRYCHAVGGASECLLFRANGEGG